MCLTARSRQSLDRTVASGSSDPVRPVRGGQETVSKTDLKVTLHEKNTQSRLRNKNKAKTRA